MGTTIIVYVGMLLVLGGAAVYLVLRDLAARPAAAVAAGGPRIVRLPLSGDEPAPTSISETLDQRFRHLIYQSGLDLSPLPAWLMMLCVGLAAGGAVFLWRDDLLLAVLAFLVGFGAPLLVYRQVRARRLTQFREQLPEAMELMSRSVRAGETLDQALDNVGRQTAEPAGLEFRRVARQVEMGLAVPAAMGSLVRRVPLTELRILSTALTVQRRTGGNLGETLDRLASVIRDRLSYQRQFLAATGASRVATLLIALTGPLVFAYMLVFQPDYIGQFFQLAGGYTMLATAVVLQVVGLAWIVSLLRSNY